MKFITYHVLAGYTMRGNHQCMWCVWITFKYYHYQPGSEIIIVYCKHITHARTHARAHTHTHTHTLMPPSPFRLPLFDGSAQPSRSYAPFRRFRWQSMVVHCFIQINTGAGDPVSPRFLVFFAYRQIARPNWGANSWQDVLSVDTNSLRHLPRRSSQNCDLQFANIDRQT